MRDQLQCAAWSGNDSACCGCRRSPRYQNLYLDGSIHLLSISIWQSSCTRLKIAAGRVSEAPRLSALLGALQSTLSVPLRMCIQCSTSQSSNKRLPAGACALLSFRRFDGTWICWRARSDCDRKRRSFRWPQARPFVLFVSMDESKIGKKTVA